MSDLPHVLPLLLRIRSVSRVTARASIVKLALDGRRFVCRAGQAVLVGDHGCVKPRAYSLAAPPDHIERDYALELLVGTDPAGTAGAHLTLETGGLVDVHGPIGSFVLPDDIEQERICFVGGGTGIAPLRAMLHEALRTPNREIVVLHSARTRDDFAYGEELQALAQSGRIVLRQTVTRDDLGGWAGDRGRFGRHHLADVERDGPAAYFVCGPPPLVADVFRILGDLNVPAERIKCEEWLRPPAPHRQLRHHPTAAIVRA